VTVLSRGDIILEAQLHSRSSSALGSQPQTSTAWINLVCEIYDWLYRYVTPSRWSYLSQVATNLPGSSSVQSSGDLGLVIGGGLSGAGAFTMTNAYRGIEQITDVWYTAVAGGTTVGDLLDGGILLTPVEPHELLELRRRGVSGVLPRYVAWRPKGVQSLSASAIGNYQLLVAPSKPVADVSIDWTFTLRARLALSWPDDDVSTTPILPLTGSLPDVLAHESRLIGRLAAYEMLIRNGGDPTVAQSIVRNVNEAIMKSFTNDRKLQLERPSS
jgi:hypothetical protein